MQTGFKSKGTDEAGNYPPYLLDKRCEMKKKKIKKSGWLIIACIVVLIVGTVVVIAKLNGKNKEQESIDDQPEVTAPVEETADEAGMDAAATSQDSESAQGKQETADDGTAVSGQPDENGQTVQEPDIDGELPMIPVDVSDDSGVIPVQTPQIQEDSQTQETPLPDYDGLGGHEDELPLIPFD